jgi:GDP-D-mannose dehydratase
MMQKDKPDDFAAESETSSVREFPDEAFGKLDMHWEEAMLDRLTVLPSGRSRFLLETRRKKVS